MGNTETELTISNSDTNSALQMATLKGGQWKSL